LAPKDLLQIPALMMVTGLTSGLLLGAPPPEPAHWATAALLLLMTLSLSEMPLGGLGTSLRRAPAGAALNLGLLSTLFLGISLVGPGDLRAGWIIMAAVPSAVSVVPFTLILKGDLHLTVASTLLLYTMALAITPLITLTLVGAAVQPWELLRILLLLVALPLILSRPVAWARLPREPVRAVRNLSFFLLNFTVGAVNRPTLVAEPLMALAAAGGCALVVLTAFVVTVVLLKAGGRGGPEATSLLLLSTYKNSGLAATMALALLGSRPEALLPPTMMLVFEVGWITFLVRWVPRHGPGAW
jgi:BASS family bile acid:Na+ symporter